MSSMTLGAGNNLAYAYIRFFVLEHEHDKAGYEISHLKQLAVGG